MGTKNPEVTTRFGRYESWQPELEKLRDIVLDCGLTEEYKWEEACYSFEDANIALIHGFKEYFALLFFKGALMADPEHILIQQTENVQAGRQIRFTSMAAVEKMDSVLRQYIAEAIRVEKAGLKVEYKKTEDYEVPEELHRAFSEDPGFRNAFYALTPGRQRGYLLYFAGAKQVKTREERIEKYKDLIFDGFGMQDEYNQTKGS
jgi:uncharacterized protein YdeI (YjbR/CyaY-like superfamily)